MGWRPRHATKLGLSRVHLPNQGRGVNGDRLETNKVQSADRLDEHILDLRWNRCVCAQHAGQSTKRDRHLEVSPRQLCTKDHKEDSIRRRRIRRSDRKCPAPWRETPDLNGGVEAMQCTVALAERGAWR